MISISFYLLLSRFCYNAKVTCQCKINLQGVIYYISSFPDIRVIKPLAPVERCHCGPYEWRESYHDESI